MKRKVPRATLKRIIKGKRRIYISKSADLAVYVSLVLALERLAKAACDKSRETKEKVITEQHIKLVFRDVLASLKG